jgi:hypothetical protein
MKHRNHILSLNSQILEYRNKCETTIASLKLKTLEEALWKSLNAMDKTHRYYNNEDEANRELTDCLNVLGFNATYHYELGNKRIVDIQVDQYAMVEGKLDPDLSEIDRLVGQVTDYLKFHKYMYIVVYGNLDSRFKERIQSLLLNIYPDRLSLIYLKNPNRIRTAKSSSDNEDGEVIWDLKNYTYRNRS